MEHGVALRDVPLDSIILADNHLWTLKSKGQRIAGLLTINPQPRGWTTDRGTLPLDAVVSVLTPEEADEWQPTAEKFVVEIDLGNEAMQSGYDVTTMLSVFAEGGSLRFDHEPLSAGRQGTFSDENGNTVGRWEVR